MDRAAYINECKLIEGNCIYSAEAHHILADRAKRAGVRYKVVPAVGAAITSALTVLGVFPRVSAVLTVIAATATALGNIIEPDKSYQSHLSAAKGFTLLKHDARFLKDADGSGMGDDQLAEAVRNLHNRYNDFVRGVPPTDKRSFEDARKAVKTGIHEPD